MDWELFEKVVIKERTVCWRSRYDNFAFLFCSYSFQMLHGSFSRCVKIYRSFRRLWKTVCDPVDSFLVFVNDVLRNTAARGNAHPPFSLPPLLSRVLVRVSVWCGGAEWLLDRLVHHPLLAPGDLPGGVSQGAGLLRAPVHSPHTPGLSGQGAVPGVVEAVPRIQKPALKRGNY